MRSSFLMHRPWTFWLMAPLVLAIATGGRIGWCDCDGKEGSGGHAARTSACCAAERDGTTHERAAPASGCPRLGNERPADICHCADSDVLVGEPAKPDMGADHGAAHAFLERMPSFRPLVAAPVSCAPSSAPDRSRPPPLYVIHCSYRCGCDRSRPTPGVEPLHGRQRSDADVPIAADRTATARVPSVQARPGDARALDTLRGSGLTRS